MVAPAIIGLAAAGGLLGGKSGSRDRKTYTDQTSSFSPWGPTSGPLRNIVDMAGSLFGNYWPSYPDVNPPSFGYGQATQDVMGQLLGNAQSGPSNLYQGVSDYILNNLGNKANNPYIDQVFNNAGNYRPDYIDQFINQAGGSGFFGSSEPYMHNLLSQTAFGGGDNSGLFGISGDYLTRVLDSFLGPEGSAFQPGGLFSDSYARPTIVTNAHSSRPNFGSAANNPYLDDLKEAIRSEGEETYKRLIVPQVDSEYIRAGRYGSGAYQFAQARSFEEAMEAINNQVADTMFQAWENAANRASQENIARSSGASAASGAANSAATARQGQLLNFLGSVLGLGVGADQFAGSLGGDVLGLLSGTDQFNAGSLFSGIGLLDAANQGMLGLQGDMAGLYNNLLQGNQAYDLGLLGTVPGLETAAQIPNQLLGGLLGPLMQGDIARYESGLGQFQNEFNRQQYNNTLPYQMLEQYLGTIGPLGQTFGTQQTSGTNTQPGAGFLPGALQGALGGAMLGSGLSGGGGFGAKGGGGQPSGLQLLSGLFGGGQMSGPSGFSLFGNPMQSPFGMFSGPLFPMRF